MHWTVLENTDTGVEFAAAGGWLYCCPWQQQTRPPWPYFLAQFKQSKEFEVQLESNYLKKIIGSSFYQLYHRPLSCEKLRNFVVVHRSKHKKGVTTCPTKKIIMKKKNKKTPQGIWYEKQIGWSLAQFYFSFQGVCQNWDVLLMFLLFWNKYPPISWVGQLLKKNKQKLWAIYDI